MISKDDTRNCSKVEWTRLPIRGPKNESTELYWFNMNPSEWLENLEAEANSTGTLTATDNPRYHRSGAESFPTSMPQLSTSPTLNETRNQESPYLDMETLPLEMELFIASIDPTSMPYLWTFQTLRPSPLVDRTRKLVLAIEAQSNFEDLKPSLEQIRDHFTFWISKTKSLAQKQALERFEMLCREAITKLQRLLAHAMRVSLPQECTVQVPSPDATVSLDYDSVQSSPVHTVNRAAFHSHMNNWLRANWINPYPDEAVSHQLAYETGEHVHVVNTWLVNARSRRWRPAVLKAFELGRPSEYLLEDSINLFEDRPLRTLQEVTVTESNKRTRKS